MRTLYAVKGHQNPRQPDSPKRLTHLERLEQRYAELEREAKRVALKEEKAAACASCLWLDPNGMQEHRYWKCSHPLVKGFGKAKYVDLEDVGLLCTDERLLWEPRPTRWQRFIAWLSSLFA